MYSREHSDGALWVERGALVFVGFVLAKIFIGFLALAAVGIWMIAGQFSKWPCRLIRGTLIVAGLFALLVAIVWIVD